MTSRRKDDMQGQDEEEEVDFNPHDDQHGDCCIHQMESRARLSSEHRCFGWKSSVSLTINGDFQKSSYQQLFFVCKALLL